ncbi:MAG TPA: PDZ domain-containing protein [Polyangiaceae bacterium]|nr:PDZ domain-containing protein [Polyangiaceae bacterium]
MRMTLPIIAALVFSSSAALAYPKPNPARQSAHPTAETQTTQYAFSTARGRLGALVVSMTDELRAFFGAGPGSGVLVSRVSEQTPASAAGLRVGDVLLRVNARKIVQPSDVAAAINEEKRGTLVPITIVRNKRKLQLHAVLDSDPLAMPNFDLGFRFDSPFGNPAQDWFRPFDRWFRGSPQLPKDLDERLRKLEKRFDELQKRQGTRPGR